MGEIEEMKMNKELAMEAQERDTTTDRGGNHRTAIATINPMSAVSAMPDPGEWGMIKHRLYNSTALSDENSCWLWLGATDKSGYGMMHVGRSHRAHRLSYLVHVDIIPSGLHVCHTCDNPSCVNPYHLFLGTQGDNNRDRHQKNRYNHQARGEAHGNSKFTANDVLQLRQHKSSDPSVSISMLSRTYHMSRKTVRDILNNKTWKHA